MIKNLMPRSKFAKNVITLITGTALAQALPIAITPILTRLYTPEDFGIFATFMAISTILVVLVTGRYELAIIVPEKDEDAANIVALSVLLSTIISLCILFIVVIFGNVIASGLGREEVELWMYLIPVSTMVMGCYQSLNYWNNRRSEYKIMATSRVVQSAAASTFQLGTGFLKAGSTGLVLGQILGQISALLFLLKFVLTDIKSFEGKIDKINILRMAKKYIKFPQYLILAHGFNTGSSQAPALLLSGMFSAAAAGFYMLTQRILSAPIALIAGAIGDVFRQEASSAYLEYGQCRKIYISTLIKLFTLSLVPFAVLFFWAEEMFTVVFGREWQVAGEYAVILTPMFFLRFIVSPLSYMFMIAQAQRLDLLWQITLFASVVSALLIGKYMDSVKFSLVCFSAAYCFMYLVNLAASYKLACGWRWAEGKI